MNSNEDNFIFDLLVIWLEKVDLKCKKSLLLENYDFINYFVTNTCLSDE